MQKFMKTLCLLIIFSLGIFLLRKFINTDYFKIKEISVNVQSEFLKKDITNKLEMLKEKNIVYIDTNKVEKMLKNDVRIKNISIRKRYPSKLIINMEERKPYVYIKNGDEIYLADEDLNIFGYIYEIDSKDIPIVIYDGNEEVKKDLKIIISKIKNKDLYDMISEIKKSDKDYRLIFNNGVEVITDTLVSSDKYDKVYKLYEQIKEKQEISYMDIRFKDVNVK